MTIAVDLGRKATKQTNENESISNQPDIFLTEDTCSQDLHIIVRDICTKFKHYWFISQ